MNPEQMQTQLQNFLGSPQARRGNDARFDINNVEYNADSPLSGKRIGFLGSSITYGAGSYGISFVDYLQARDGVVATKSAVSGTTLARDTGENYLPRLKRDFKGEYDYFVCQLSTNDNRYNIPMGEITPDSQMTDFDTNTTLGAIEEVCAYVKNNLHAPLAFYTCLRDASEKTYPELIKQLKLLQKKWDFDIIDLYDDEGVKATTRMHSDAMVDDAHPTQEGYLKIWLPVFEKELAKLV